ncbi:hypothetical protein [Aquisediminimonas profunda]|uniref:hypothetical protein n=1 Tax=Aquisediminimonas profunda TaxID=1550733 RepID=UPI001FE91300|nr:hypothetical protein [Aquisediminimonas profunda]
MRFIMLAALSASSMFAVGSAYAQTTLAAPLAATPNTAPVTTAAVLPPVAAVGQAVLRTGTEVPLTLAEHLTTKNKAVRVNQRFRMTVSADVKVDGQTVIPVGSPAMGEITDVRNKGMWGKSGHIGARILYVQVGGRQIRLSGTFDDKGVTGTAGVVAAIAFVPIAGFFTTGTSADLPLGGAVKGFVDEDVPLSFATQQTAPLEVTPTPPAMVLQAPASSSAAVQPPK